MSTDATFEEDCQAFVNMGKLQAERPQELTPAILPKPHPNARFRNFYVVLESGRRKRKQLDKDIDFAEQLIPLQMKPKVMQKSVKLQHGFTTRQVRSIIRAARPKKHRER